MQDKFMRRGAQEALASKTSRDSRRLRRGNRSTTGTGALRLDPIEGVRYRLARPVFSSSRSSHGSLSRRLGADGRSCRSGHLTTTFPGRIRAWGSRRPS